MKESVETTDRLVDINRLNLSQIIDIRTGLRLRALAGNAPAASHPLVRRHYPLLTQAILAGASAQIRYAATNGGNLLQRTRCYYFYDVACPATNAPPAARLTVVRCL